MLMNEKLLKLGIPAGSLQESTGELFRKAGYKITFASRSYYRATDDPQGQAAAAGRRHCRGHGDRQLAPGQQLAHRGRLTAKHHALYHQRALLCRSLEETEDG